MSTDVTDKDRQPRDQAGTAETDARDLVERLRSAPAEEVMASLFSTLLSTAQVKLGRRDARLFIDLCALMLDQAGPFLSDEVRKQVERALGQLRLGQVSAESEVAKRSESDPNDLGRIPTPPTTGGRSRDSSVDQSAPASSKLWVPGR